MPKPNRSQGAIERRTVALVYARKSIVRTKQDTVSPERQIDLCKAEAERSGLAVEVYVDAEGHRSGRSEKHRPEWRKLKAQLGRPDIAAVIVADVSRASRSVKDGLTFLDECQRRGIDFVDLRYRIDTRTATGRMMAGMLLSLLQWEADVASERATEAITYKREFTHRHVGNAPFGTQRDGKGVLVESEDWPACQALLEAYAGGAHSIYSLPAHLNAQGLRFRDRAHQPVPFDRYSVRSVISNVLTYAGFIVVGHGKEMTIPLELDMSGDVVERLAAHVGAIAGQHAPLISRELAARVIRARRSMMKPHGSQERRDYILAPVLRCAHCGEPMRGAFKYGRPLYVHKGRVCVRRAAQPDAGDLERDVIARLAGLRLSADARAELRRRVEYRLAAVPEHAELVEAIRNLEAKAERLKVLYLEGDIDKALYDQQKRATATAIADLRGRLDPAPQSLDVIFQELDSIADILAHGAPREQRRAIGDLFERIEVDLRGQVATMVAREWVRAVFPDWHCLAAVPSEKLAQH